MLDRALARSADAAVALADDQVAAARRYADASRATSTRRKYEADFEAFGFWCREHGHDALPASPAVVAVYLSSLADTGLAPPTIARKLAAIGWVHRRAGQQPPHRLADGVVIADVLAGVRRSRVRPVAKKAAADGDVVRDVLRAINGRTLADVRDRAVIGFGMASALRRSELVALDVSDVVRKGTGIHVLIRSSKTDQEHRGETIAILNGRRIRPVALLDAWLSAAGITEGPLFRSLVNGVVGRSALSPQKVRLIVRKRFAEAGYDADDYSAHSLRSGFLTSAAASGATIWKMRDVSRHKSIQVLSGYVRAAELLDDHAGKDFL